MKNTRNRSKKTEPEKSESMIFRVTPELKDTYLNFCEDNGYSYGKRLRLLMEKDLNDE